MDCVTMKLLERETGLPLDLVVLINSFLYEKLIDANIFNAITLWFEDEEECKFRFGHISFWNTSRVTNMNDMFYNRSEFNEDISRWDVRNVTNMSGMFYRASRFNRDLSRWNVTKVENMSGMFAGATQFNADLSQWDVANDAI
jgi:surface protein